MNRHEFWTKMRSMYAKTPDDYGLREYNERMNKRNLTAAELDRLYEWLTDNCSYFPALAQFQEGCNTLSLGQRKTGMAAVFHKFRLGTNLWYRKIADPSNLPVMPDGAMNQGLVIPPEVRYDDESPCSQEEGREIFAAAFLEAGGDLAKLKAMQRAVVPVRRAAPEPEHEPELVAVADDDYVPF